MHALKIPQQDQNVLQDKCKIDPQMLDEGVSIDEIAQYNNIDSIFKNWQEIIKVYRGDDKNYSDDENDRTEIQEDSHVGNQAHFDVLAEAVCKLIAQRPDIQAGKTFTKQDLIESTTFVDYDRIDVVERDDDMNDMMNNMKDEISTTKDSEKDTLDNQSRISSKE